MNRRPAVSGRRWSGAPLAAAALALAIAWLLGAVRTRAGWDETYYMLQTSSLVEDGDLDLRNDALHSSLATPELLAFLTTTQPGGGLDNVFSIGPAVLWSPAYVAALPWRESRGSLGMAGAVPRRWDAAQLAALHLLSLALLVAVAWCLWRLLEAAGSCPGQGPRPASGVVPAATAALLLGTPLAVYGPALYTMAHLPSAAAVCLLLAGVSWLDREPRPLPALMAGAALGLVFLMRWQDAVFALLLGVPLAPLVPLPGRRRGDPRRLAALLGMAAAGALAVAALQLHGWRLERGAWLTVPQGEEFLRWGSPDVADFLLAGRSGLLAWSPVFALGAAGLLLPWRSRLPARWRLAALAVLAAEVYVNAAAQDWWGGHSFGARRMTSCVPLLALGLGNLACLGAAAGRRWAGAALVALLLAFAIWGCFVANLYWQGVNDLSLVVRGAPSHAPEGAYQESGAVTEPAAARRRAFSLALGGRSFNYWAASPAVTGSRGTAWTWLLMAATAAGTGALLAWTPPRRLLAGVLAGLLGLGVCCQLRLATGPRPDAAERAAWQRLAAQWRSAWRGIDLAAARPPPGARGAWLSAADARAFLALSLEWQAGDPRHARGLLDRLAGRGYPAAVAVRDESAAVAHGETVLRLLPGAFFTLEEEEPYLGISLPQAGRTKLVHREGGGVPFSPLLLPPRRQAAALQCGQWRQVDVAFDVRIPGLEPKADYDLVSLLDGSAAEPARVVLRGAGTVELQTARGTRQAAVGPVGGGSCRVLLRYSPAEGLVSLDFFGPRGRLVHLASPLAAGQPPPVMIGLGRPRQSRRPTYPLWDATFSDLWATARP
ncbi:MAG TPA: hypothetical protein VHQ90_24935 [Thermoanaerobaculia bacterium]|nr:hypothetical protein [Thermoanaerobaculia bacterium]